MLRQEYMYIYLVMLQERNMWNFLTSLFKNKQEDKGYNDPFTEMIEMKRQYENEQHEKAMKAEIKKETLDEELRRKGLI